MKKNIFVTSAQMRALDKKAIEDYKIPAETLMENAGRGCAKKIIEISKDKIKCVVVCSTGNNGGDGLVIARYLAEQNIKSYVFIPQKDNYNDLVSLNLKRLDECNLVTLFKLPDNISLLKKEIANCDFVVDALLGTGATGAPKKPIADIINIVNTSKKIVFSIDIPTGMNPDDGTIFTPCIKADYTLTLGLNKKGFLNPSSVTHTGKVSVIDIGLPKELIK